MSLSRGEEGGGGVGESLGTRLLRNHFLAKLVVILENDLHIHQLELNVVFMLVPKSAPSKVWLHSQHSMQCDHLLYV